ncbi:MAG TPA: glycosyltransferase family 2 protein, partial [Friedmanniella sp.]
MSTFFELPQDTESDDAAETAVPVVEQETATDAALSRYLHQHLADIEALPTYRPRIGVIIPAYNEAESIEDVLRGLLAQTRLPDEIHLIVNNTKDNTFELAAPFAGPHKGPKVRGQKRQRTEVFVHDIGENPDKKVGALNYGFTLIQDAEYLLGVDGDTVLAPNAVEKLEAEIVSDTRIGGISAIY